jgi:hypothetical protein
MRDAIVMWKKVRCQVVVAVLALTVPAAGFGQDAKKPAFEVASIVHRPVIDKTGLEGVYESRSSWTRTPAQSAGFGASASPRPCREIRLGS